MVTVDPGLIDAGNKAVREGRADSLSGWVNAALVAWVVHGRRLEALSGAIADYEAEFGPITDEEMARVCRADREAAVAVRAQRSKGRSSRSGRGAA